MRLTSIRKCGLIALLLTANVMAGDKIYSWVDGNGVTHFSYKMPAQTDAAKVTTITIKKSDSYKTPTQAAAESSMDKASLTKELDRITNKNCATASNNLKILTAFSNITQESADGQVVTLSKQQKSDQLELTRKQVELFCQR